MQVSQEEKTMLASALLMLIAVKQVLICVSMYLMYWPAKCQKKWRNRLS